LEQQLPPGAVRDFVAISRQVGSGGSQIARELAERLDWPLFDKEILHAMAGDDASRERLYEWMDECDRGWIEQMLEFRHAGRFPPQDYVRKLSATVLALSRGAPAVFLGRATDLILPAEHGLRVRVVAPFEERMRRYAERSHVGNDLAREAVTRIDHERGEFVRHHFHRTIDDPVRCDLTLNTARVSVTEAVELVLALLRKRGVAP
jgi:cytidylate kinase